PIRVELESLTADDFARILTEPHASLTQQYRELLGTEGLQIHFTEDGIRRIAEIAFGVNERTENIRARRLPTVMERLLEVLSFDAGDLASRGERPVIDSGFVDANLETLARDQDLSRFIL